MSHVIGSQPDHDEDAAEVAALAEAVASSRANPRAIPHEEMRSWLLEVAAGNFDAKRPLPRKL